MKKKPDHLQLALITIKRQYRELRKKQPDIMKVNVNHQFDFNLLSTQGVSWTTIKRAAKSLGIISQSKDGELIWIWPDGKEKKRYLRRRLREIIQILYDYLKDKTQPSLHHDDPMLDCSVTILQEALIALGVEGVKLNSINYWLPAARTIQQAFKTLGDERIKKLDQDSAREFYHPVKKQRVTAAQIALRDIMIAYKFDASAKEVIEDLEQFGYSRITAHRVKKRLHISSIKRSDGWYWIYPAQTVQTWLENLMIDRPLIAEALFHAAAEKGWSRNVVEAARRQLGGIHDTYIRGKKCWYNMNRCSPPFPGVK